MSYFLPHCILLIFAPLTCLGRYGWVHVVVGNNANASSHLSLLPLTRARYIIMRQYWTPVPTFSKRDTDFCVALKLIVDVYIKIGNHQKTQTSTNKLRQRGKLEMDISWQLQRTPMRMQASIVIAISHDMSEHQSLQYRIVLD